MNNYFNRNTRNKLRGTKPYSKSNVNGYINPVGTNVPGITKISTDKSKDQQKKSTRGNNKVINYSNPLNSLENTKPENNKAKDTKKTNNTKTSKEQLVRIDVTKGNNGAQNRVFKTKNGDTYYTDDRGEHHLIKDYDPNSKLQYIAHTEESTDPEKPTKRETVEKIRASQNRNREDLTQTHRVTGDKRVSPTARKNLLVEGYSQDEATDILNDVREDIERDKLNEALTKKFYAESTQRKTDGVSDNVDSLVDNFFNGFQNSLYGIRSGINQASNFVASPFLSDEQNEYNELVAQRLKAEQDAETTNKYERNNGGLGLVQDASNGLGGLVPTVLAGLFGGAGVGNAMLGLSSFGNAFNEALDDTDDFNKARLYGLGSAGTEMLTEKLFGSIPTLGKGFLDDVIKKGTSHGVGRIAKDMIGEGAEEYASTVIDEFLKDIYQGNEGKGSFFERLGNVQPEAINSGIVGGLIGGLVNTPSYVKDAVNKRIQVNLGDSEILNTADTKAETNVDTVEQIQPNNNIIAKPLEAQENAINEERQAVAEDSKQMEDFVEGDSDVVDKEYSDDDSNVINEVIDDVEDDIDDAESYYLKEASHTLVMDEDFDGQPREVQQDYTGIKEKDPLRQEHIDKYGAIRPESKYKVEKSTDGKNRVHQTIDTLVNSKMFKGRENVGLVDSIRDDVTYNDKGTYAVKTVQEVQDRARSFIDSYDSFTDAIESITNTDKKYQDKVEEQGLKADDMLYVYGKLTEDMIALKNANPNDVELQKYLDDKIADTLPLFTEIANESGRALRYIQAIRATVPAYSYAKAQLKMVDRFINRQNNILKKSGKEFVLPTEIQEMLDSPNAVNYTAEEWGNIFKMIGNEAAKQAPKSLFDRIRTIRYLSMLMNPRTWIRNIAGNTVNYGFNGVSDTFRWMIENSISKFDKNGRFFYTVSNKGPFYVNQDLVSTINSNISNLNPNYGVKVEPNALENYKNQNEVSKGFGKVIDIAQKINEFALDKPDLFFSKRKYVSTLAQVLDRNGINADLLNYLIETPIDNRYEDIDINGTTYTYDDLTGKRIILDKAIKFAERRSQEITYRQDNSIDQIIKGLMNSDKTEQRVIGKFINAILPFTKTPFNIATEMVKDSPLGIAQGLKQLNKALKTGGDINQAIETMCKGLTGTGVLLLGMFLNSQGFLTGDGNDMDDKEKEFAEQRGWKPFAFRYDGDGATTYADISALTPMAMSLALGAVINEMTESYISHSNIDENGEPKNSFEAIDAIETLKDLAITLAEPWTNMSAVSGIGNTIPQYTDSDGEFLVNFIYNTGKNYVSQFIPQVLKQINRTFNDPKIHTTQGMGNTTDKFVSSLSKDSLLTSKNNNVAIDYRGNEKEYFDEFMGLDGTLGRTVNNFINPFTMSQEKDDTTADELLRLYKETGESSVIPSNSYVKSYTKDGTKYEVNRDEWQEINEDKRQKYMQYVDEFVNSQEYQTMSDSERVEVIQALKDLATDNNKSMLLENKGVDYSSSMMNKVSAGEQQGLKAYQTVMLNPDKKALISTESTGDLLVSLSKNGFDEQGAREYLSSVGNEISENDEKMIKGMFQQGDTYNQLMDEFARSMPQGLDDYTQDKTYTKAGKKLAKCLGEYQQLMEGADVSTTDYERLARAMNSGVSVYEYLTIASHNSMKEEIEYMRDTLGRSADEIMWFEQNIMNRSKGKLNEAWEILNGN